MIKLLYDPGHGGYDPGAIGNGVREKDLMLLQAKYAKEFMEKTYEGVKVYLTRTDDRFVSLRERADMANRLGVDGFVSFHANSAQNLSATGWETYTSVAAGAATQRFRGHIDDAVMSILEQYRVKDRGRKRENHTVTVRTNCKAVLTESLFLSNKNDVDLLVGKHRLLEKIAEGICIGVARDFGLKEKKGEIVQMPKQNERIYQPPEVQKRATRTVLKRLEGKKESPLSPMHRKRLDRGELTIDEAIGLLYVAVERGHITGK